jgi:hypothetical protein
MPEEQRVRRNIRRMIDQGATEDEIDQYISLEGLDVSSIKKPSDGAVESFAKGVVRGVRAGAGTIADAPQNLYQLGKAGIGTVIGALGGTPPDLGETNVASRYLNKQFNKFANVEPENPTNVGRFTGTLGEIGGAGLVSGTPLSPSGVGMNIVAPAVGGAVGEQIGGESGKFVGSLAAPLGIAGGKAAASSMVDSSKAKTLSNSGVGPSFADVSKGGAYAQKSVGYLPTGAFFNAAGIKRQEKELEAFINKLIPRKGVTPDIAGEIIQDGLENWKSRFTTNYQLLKNKTETALPPTSPAAPLNYKQALEDLTQANPAAPKSTQALIPQDLVTRLKNLDDDMQGGVVTVSALKQIKEEIGSIAFPKYGMMVDKDQGQYIKLYKALVRDIEDAAKAQDLRVDPTGKTRTAQLAQRTENAYYTAGRERIRDFYNKVQKKADPEKAFKALMSDNGEMLRVTTKALTKPERDVFVSAAIDWMGRTKPGIATLDRQFSAETFLTQWNALSEKSKRAVFAGTSSPSLYKDIDDVAKAASVLRETRQVMPNPSGSALGVSGGATVAAATSGYFLNPLFYAPLAASAGAAYLMNNPRFIRWLAQGVNLSAKDAKSHVIRLGNMATLSRDGEFQENVNQYIQSLDQ